MDEQGQDSFGRRTAGTRGRAQASARGLRIAVLAALLAPLPGWSLYKVVGPDGSITYTDRIPPQVPNTRVLPAQRTTFPASAAVGNGPPALPAELRLAVQRHPVTLYTTSDCPPCGQARQLLVTRGVPYQERIVENAEQSVVLERLTGARTLPALTVGVQPLRGYLGSEWQAYLDAAGYPRQSVLPRGWQQPPAQPLAVPRAAAVEIEPPRVDPAPRADPVLPPASPSGIRF